MVGVHLQQVTGILAYSIVNTVVDEAEVGQQNK